MAETSVPNIELTAADTISTWLTNPLLLHQGFLQVSVRSTTGRSKVNIFDALDNDLPPAQKGSRRLHTVRQTTTRQDGLLFIEHSPITTAVSLSSLENAMRGGPCLDKSNLANGKPGPFHYLPDLNYTKTLARMLRMPWPPLLLRLEDNLLKKHKPIEGISIPYLYISPSKQGSIFGLHKEDYNLYSLNLLHFGTPKKWIMIHPSQQAALCRLLEPIRAGSSGTNYPEAICDQWIRHLGVFVPHTALEKAGIQYTEVTQKVGDLIITGPGTYHQGLNSGANVAEAINFASPRSEEFAKGYRHCTYTCRPEVDGDQAFKHLVRHDFVADAPPPIIINFESMRAPPSTTRFKKSITSYGIEAATASYAAFGSIPYHDFPSSLVRQFYADYPPPKSLPSDLRRLKVRFANDVSRVFKDKAEFSETYPEWPGCSLSLSTMIQKPSSPRSISERLSLNSNAPWKRVCPQARGPPWSAIACNADLEALRPLNAAGRLQLRQMNQTHLGLSDYSTDAASRSTVYYEYRGQGPPSGIWIPASAQSAGQYDDAMSSALDACIVAGMLLDVGRTNADYATQPHDPASLQAIFLKTCGVDWRSLSIEESLRAKHELSRHFLSIRPELGITRCKDLIALSARSMVVSGQLGIWARCTAGLGQFTFSGQALRYCKKCDARDLISLHEPFFSASEVLFTGLDYTKDMVTLVQHYFDGQVFNKPCTVCNKSSTTYGRRILDTEPPLRMAISMNQLYSIEKNPLDWSTLRIPDNLDIKYYSRGESKQRTAEYKWLGGIYMSYNHLRVYWENDSSLNIREVMRSGEVPDIAVARRIQMYDGDGSKLPGMQRGLIIGDIPPLDLSFRVPTPWQNGAEMLFYERTR